MTPKVRQTSNIPASIFNEAVAAVAVVEDNQKLVDDPDNGYNLL